MAQVLHRQRKAVHPAAPFAARQFGVARVGFGQRQRRVAQRDDGVEARVQRLDARQRGLHDLAAGHIARGDAARQFGGAEGEQVVGRRHGACWKRRGAQYGAALA
jgi:hypothetical protein